MTTQEANRFVEEAALEAAYNAGVEAAIAVIEAYMPEASADEADLLHEIVTEVATLQEAQEEMN